MDHPVAANVGPGCGPTLAKQGWGHMDSDSDEVASQTGSEFDGLGEWSSPLGQASGSKAHSVVGSKVARSPHQRTLIWLPRGTGRRGFGRTLCFTGADHRSGGPATNQQVPTTCSPNMKTLGLSAILFTIITVLQAFGAVAANSQSLLVDCVSMGVDAGSYVGSMLVETFKGTPFHTPLELLVGGLSLSALVYFTINALKDTFQELSAGRFPPSSEPDEQDKVNPLIIFGFAIFGLTFDALSLWAFARSGDKMGAQMNMWTACLHVGADALRSFTTLIMSLIIMILDVDGEVADAWTSPVLGAMILSGVAWGMFAWVKEVAQWALAPLDPRQAAAAQLLEVEPRVALHV